MLNIVDGRDELGRELESVPPALRDALLVEFARLLDHPDFANALPGLLADAARTDIVLRRLRQMAK